MLHAFPQTPDWRHPMSSCAALCLNVLLARQSFCSASCVSSPCQTKYVGLSPALPCELCRSSSTSSCAAARPSGCGSAGWCACCPTATTARRASAHNVLPLCALACTCAGSRCRVVSCASALVPGTAGCLSAWNCRLQIGTGCISGIRELLLFGKRRADSAVVKPGTLNPAGPGAQQRPPGALPAGGGRGSVPPAGV